ncbi:MAG TPA: hypothetical protein VJ276_14115 [Thermoanaerobaculia bacterium]|nr:hypothetical protein [Thermoanaerobaculia bacterium]
MRVRTAALLLVLAALPMRAATRTWTGTIDSSWMNPGNWAGGVAPVADDDLLFPAGAVRLTATNDFPPLTRFHSITTSAAGYDLNGFALTLGASGPLAIHGTCSPASCG